MNLLGLVWIGAVLRATIFALAGIAVWIAVRKKGASISASIAMMTLVGMLVVSVVGASPGLRWWGAETLALAWKSAPNSDQKVKENEIQKVFMESNEHVVNTNALAKPTATDIDMESGVRRAFGDLATALSRVPTATPESRWGWQAWVGLAALGLVSLGFGRFVVGFIAVWWLRRTSQKLNHEHLNDLATVLRAELGLVKDVEFRVASGLTTPATVGWKSPVIFLPEDWTEWDEETRRVVLAHELAHIRRNDYVMGVWGQLCLALQYYNPLAHWLAGRLRLEQELAADAWGASLAGGNKAYLTTLARMALRKDPRPVGWPARSFRPARGTFLRRIEMLRDMNDSVISPPLPRRSRWVTLGILLVAGTAISGFRGPLADRLVEAAAQAPAQEASQAATIEHGFISADTAMILVVRPADLLTRPDIAKLVESITPLKELETRAQVKIKEIEQITLIWTYSTGAPVTPAQPMLAPSGFIVRMKQATDFKSFFQKNIPGFKELKSGEVMYFAVDQSPGGMYASLPDDRTLVVASEGLLFRMLSAKPGATDRSAWAPAFAAVKKGQLAVAVDVTEIRSRIKATGPDRPDVATQAGAFAPLLEQTSAYAIGLSLNKSLDVDVRVISPNDEAAKRVSDTLRASVILGRNALAAIDTKGQEVPSNIKPLMDFVGGMLDKMTIDVESRSVHAQTSTELSVDRLANLMVGPMVASRAAAQRSQSQNNLKQIGLAFHNYADTYGKFPASTIIGPDGKTPHSWRVALLPYLDQAPLYNQYKMNEPWDSPSNLQVLEKMPMVYLNPNSKSKKNSSYYVLTGKATPFDGTTGLGIASITDGTSNTILAVEAEREIPWTKPEDIPYDADKEIPALGGFAREGFSTLFADGSVRFLAKAIDVKVLKALISPAGGEVIPNY
jgi:beta-lactamase regulating signal transducer with metallopeptidase domain